MSSKYIISEPYEIDPSKIKYDSKICNFNKRKPKEKYEALVEHIRVNGQTQPGYMRDSFLGDGVHRAMACRELGIRMKVVDIDPTISDEDYILLCNENTFVARNDTPTQLAIKGLQLVKLFGYTDSKAILMLGIKDSKSIGYARTIMDSPLNKEYKILDTLAEGEYVFIGEVKTKSIGIAKRAVKTIEESRLRPDWNSKLDEPTPDYDSMLKTEVAKEDFWKWQEKLVGSDMKLHYIAVLNEAYKIEEK